MFLNPHCKLEFFLIPKNYYAVYLLMILNFFVKQVKPENWLNKIFLHDQYNSSILSNLVLCHVQQSPINNKYKYEHL